MIEAPPLKDARQIQRPPKRVKISRIYRQAQEFGMSKQKVEHMNLGGAELVASIGWLRSELTVAQVIGHVVIWLLVVMATFGIGALFWPYAAVKMIIDSIVIRDEYAHSTARLRCNFKSGQQLGHVIFWLIFMFLTGGIAALFYPFSVAYIAINKTELIST